MAGARRRSQSGDAFLDDKGEPVAVAVRGANGRSTLVASVDVLDRALAELKAGNGAPVAARSSEDDDPRLCPDPTPEPKTTTSQNSIAYQEYAALVFIGVTRTPWAASAECPHRGSLDGPACGIEVAEPWTGALDEVESLERVEVFYWLHLARRDLIGQSSGRNGTTKATFTIRSPVRPNRIGTSIVSLVERRGPTLIVRGLDCVDGTPLLDRKPDRSEFARR